jgi:hypothetical protein
MVLKRVATSWTSHVRNLLIHSRLFAEPVIFGLERQVLFPRKGRWMPDQNQMTGTTR